MNDNIQDIYILDAKLWYGQSPLQMAFTVPIIGYVKISSSVWRRQICVSQFPPYTSPGNQMFKLINPWVWSADFSFIFFPLLIVMFALLCLPLELCVLSKLFSLCVPADVFALLCFILKDCLHSSLQHILETRKRRKPWASGLQKLVLFVVRKYSNSYVPEPE